MNFDKLKDAWDKDGGEDVKIPQLETLKGAKGPAERIRKSMRGELFTQLFSFVLIGGLPFVKSLSPVFVVPYYIIYGFLGFSMAYYFIRFYFFYKRLHDNSLNSMDSLYTLYYDVKLNIEIYRSFNYFILPMVLLLMVMFIVSLFHLDRVWTLDKLMVQITIHMLLSVMATIFVIEWMIKSCYVKRMKEIGKILDELKTV